MRTFSRFVFTGIHLLSRLLDHASTNDQKQDKCYPMIYRCNKISEMNSDEIAYQRHQSLKASEPHCRRKGMSRSEFPEGQTFAYRDRKGIHGNAYRNYK
jgi:hypothetical protein